MRGKLLMTFAALLFLAADSKDDVKKDLDQLRGTWTLTSGEIDGNKLPEDQVKGELVMKEASYSWTAAGGDKGGGKFKIDPTKKPKHMDSVPNDGPAEGQTVEEIYEVEGDTLKICFALPPAKRPTEFTAPAGSGRWLFTYKRKK